MFSDVLLVGDTNPIGGSQFSSENGCNGLYSLVRRSGCLDRYSGAGVEETDDVDGYRLLILPVINPDSYHKGNQAADR